MQDTRDQIDRKKNEIKGVKTLLDQYVKNPKLGDPQTVAPQYEMARTELEKIHEREQVLGSMLRTMGQQANLILEWFGHFMVPNGCCV